MNAIMKQSPVEAAPLFKALIRNHGPRILYKTVMDITREVWAEEKYDSPQEAAHVLTCMLGTANQTVARSIKQNTACFKSFRCRRTPLEVRTAYNRETGRHTMLVRCNCCGWTAKLEEGGGQG